MSHEVTIIADRISHIKRANGHVVADYSRDNPLPEWSRKTVLVETIAELRAERDAFADGLKSRGEPFRIRMSRPFTRDSRMFGGFAALQKDACLVNAQLAPRSP